MRSGFWQVMRRGAALLSAGFCVSALAAPQVDTLRLPPGFRVEVLTDQVPNARGMTLGDFADGRGVVYVGSRNAGKVYGVEIDKGRAKRVHTLASGLEQPVGVAYRDGSLFVSAVSRIVALDGIGRRLDKPPVPRELNVRFPTETHHGWKFIAFGPDGWLYVPVGAPCNICEPDERRYANIQRLRPDGSGAEVVARGVRNTVGFDWNPVDGSLWFTDNGRDMLGDELPSDELNRVAKSGEHFGYPYCHQGDIADPEFGAKRACREFTPPVAKLGAHVAALGMRFYTGQMFPAAYRNSIFIAEHGSWNRSRKSGYRIVRVEVDKAGKALRQEVFAEGWLQVDAGGQEQVWGRPADVLVLPDGSLLISDDQAGAIYRVSYGGGS
ncbi:sorbosone dehydrogenase family protein [Zoogloea sp. LCSB751]|uniref:PQQ-dependent sugar dehydrogenase n=1 Tax=Zoogloea sp. LCSB751 TaxID=1965277 RepID=UPI001C1F4639|nr:sorbosone dehydrogenase family protein [Zoogloea sp. LCSB751]